ncbi:MAG: tRNA lysidine(34) synthetase TilS [Clostridiales bacterium]|nr:tRNA lysidine(34) synthetase TilS [Clostridiales bacterium]
MIEPGDKIAVAVSGGKDSLVLLLALNELRRFFIHKFDICAITVSLGFSEFDTAPIAKLCEKIGIEYHVCNTMIGDVVFNVRKEKNPCSLCANMRRGAINDMATKLGCNKVALGHNKDDFVETSIMRLFYEGNFKSFLPVTYLSRQNLYVIRPLLYVLEKEIKEYAKKNNLPIVKNPCPADRASTREDIKQLLNNLSKTNRNLKNNIFGAIQRSQEE